MTPKKTQSFLFNDRVQKKTQLNANIKMKRFIELKPPITRHRTTKTKKREIKKFTQQKLRIDTTDVLE